MVTGVVAVAVVPAPVEGAGTVGEGDGVAAVDDVVAVDGAGWGPIVALGARTTLGPGPLEVPHEQGGRTHSHVGAAAAVSIAGLYSGSVQSEEPLIYGAFRREKRRA